MAMKALNNSNLLRVLILFFPIAFMLIRHGVHLALYGIFLMMLLEHFRGATKISINKHHLVLLFAFSGIFVATILQQTITQSFNFKAFDGPSRLLIAGIGFIYLSNKKINYFKLIEISIPIGLIILFIYLLLNQQYFWGARWANIHVDPNSLGSQSTILAFLCLTNIQSREKVLINTLCILGAICGFFISIKAESRGGWATLPFMLAAWLLIQFKLSALNSNKNQYRLTLGLTLFFIFIASSIIYLNPNVSHRLSHAAYEIVTWFKDPLIYTSAGARMSMWAASAQLIYENIWGYGEIAIKEIALNHPLYSSIYQNGVKDLIQAGPHSDLMSKGLSLGVMGLIAYLGLIFIPFTLFIKNIKSKFEDIQKISQLGAIYITGVFVAGLFNETLSLKYLCSFYGLMIACLAASVLRDNASSSTQTPKGA